MQLKDYSAFDGRVDVILGAFTANIESAEREREIKHDRELHSRSNVRLLHQHTDLAPRFATNHRVSFPTQCLRPLICKQAIENVISVSCHKIFM